LDLATKARSKPKARSGPIPTRLRIAIHLRHADFLTGRNDRSIVNLD
jgi:hypothetical protein